MIEKISLALINESGEAIPIETKTTANLEMKIETAIADTFSKICYANNNRADEEIRIAEKFEFALNLQKYINEMEKNYASF